MKNKKPATKSQNQKIVSKAARGVGFKNIKEVKDFLTREQLSCSKTSEAPACSTPAPKAKEPLKEDIMDSISKEVAALLLDEHASDMYIVERAKYLIAKAKNNISCEDKERCSASGCTEQTNLAREYSKISAAKEARFVMFPYVTSLGRVFNNTYSFC